MMLVSIDKPGRHFLSFGAGVQSSALLLLVLNRDARLLAAMGGHLPEAAIFADPQSEGVQTYAHLEKMKALCADFGFPLHVVTAGDIASDILNASRFVSIPAYTKAPDTGSKGMLRRQCTREYKIDPIKQAIRNLLGLKKRQHVKTLVYQWIGISLDEIARAKPSRIPWQTKVYPLLEMGWRRGDCLAYLANQGFERVGKSSCVFCPFRSQREWLEMKREAPKDFARAVEIDHQIRDLHKTGEGGIEHPLYVHRSCEPLDEAYLGEDQASFWAPWDAECEGMCGV